MVLRKLTLLVIGISSAVLLAGCSPERAQSRLHDEEEGIGPRGGVYDNATGAPHLQLIHSARESIDIEVYEMKDPGIKAALMEAARRNVRVRLVLEPNSVGSRCNLFSEEVPTDLDCKSRWEYHNDLRSMGASIKPFSKDLCGGGGKRCFQHGKLMVVDAKSALVSTGNFNSSSVCNLSESPAKCNRDYSVVTRDRTIINALSRVFERDYFSEPYNLDSVLGTRVLDRVSVSPIAQVPLISFIDGAQSTIDVQAQYLKDPTTNEALMRAAQRGVRVRATLSSVCSFGRVSADKAEKISANLSPLEESGVKLSMFTSRNIIGGRPGYLHSKVFLVDGARAWVGSINGSATSMLANREFGLYTENPTWVSKLKEFVDQDFDSPVNQTWRANLRCDGERGAVVAGDGDGDSPNDFYNNDVGIEADSAEA